MICNDLRPDGSTEPHDVVMARAQAHLDRWQQHDLDPPVAGGVDPGGRDTLTLAAVSQLCRSSGAVFQTHVNEHLAAVERSLERRGRRPLEGLFEDGVLGPQCLLAHVTLLTPTKIIMLRDSDTAVSYNPVASAWKGNAVAAALTFAAQGIRFGIGTDGTRGDGFRLMDAAETAQRLAYGAQTGDSSMGGGWTWLDHATAADASAAGLHGVTGVRQRGHGCRLPAGRPRRAGDAAVPGPGSGNWCGWPTVTRSSRWSSPDGRGCGKAGRSTGTPGS